MNFLAILTAGVVFFMIGAVWYSPVLFLKMWLHDIGKTKEELKLGATPYIASFFLFIIICAALDCLFEEMAVATAFDGAKYGAFLAFTTVVMPILVNTLYENRRFRLWLVNAGYFLVGFAVAGAILGGWR